MIGEGMRVVMHPEWEVIFLALVFAAVEGMLLSELQKKHDHHRTIFNEAMDKFEESLNVSDVISKVVDIADQMTPAQDVSAKSIIARMKKCGKFTKEALASHSLEYGYITTRFAKADKDTKDHGFEGFGMSAEDLFSNIRVINKTIEDLRRKNCEDELAALKTTTDGAHFEDNDRVKSIIGAFQQSTESWKDLSLENKVGFVDRIGVMMKDRFQNSDKYGEDLKELLETVDAFENEISLAKNAQELGFK